MSKHTLYLPGYGELKFTSGDMNSTMRQHLPASRGQLHEIFAEQAGLDDEASSRIYSQGFEVFEYLAMLADINRPSSGFDW